MQKHVVCFTDGETDDWGAVSALLTAMMGDHILVPVIVVGEGLKEQVMSKYAIARKLVEMYGLTNRITVVAADATGYDWYPPRSRIEEIVGGPEEYARLTKDFETFYYGTDKVMPVVSAVLDRCKNVTFASLKNADTLIEIAQHQRAGSLKDVTLVAYGSFNFRMLKDRIRELIPVFREFREVHVCEAFHAIGGQASARLNDFRDFFMPAALSGPMKASNTLWLDFAKIWDIMVYDDAQITVVDVISAWGKSSDDIPLEEAYTRVMKEMDALIASTEDETVKKETGMKQERLLRNYKAMLATHPSQGVQTVFADYLVPMAIMGYLRGHGVNTHVFFDDRRNTQMAAVAGDNTAEVTLYRNVGLADAVRLWESAVASEWAPLKEGGI